MIESMLEFLSDCPAFEGKKINVNYLDGASTSYSLEDVPCEPVLRRYADGGKLCVKKFVLAMREESSLSNKRNLEVSKECQRIEKWIECRVREGNLPDAGEGIIPLSLEITKSFGAVQTASSDMRFETHLKFVFYAGE